MAKIIGFLTAKTRKELLKDNDKKLENLENNFFLTRINRIKLERIPGLWILFAGFSFTTFYPPFKNHNTKGLIFGIIIILVILFLTAKYTFDVLKERKFLISQRSKI